MSNRIIAWLLRWAMCWAEIAGGIAGVITGGHWQPDWALRLVIAWADYCEAHGIDNEPKEPNHE
jgi:hypothetical protein